jgi:hypothetical protein
MPVYKYYSPLGVQGQITDNRLTYRGYWDKSYNYVAWDVVSADSFLYVALKSGSGKHPADWQNGHWALLIVVEDPNNQLNAPGPIDSYARALAQQAYDLASAGGGGGGIPEAPQDGAAYARRNADWINADTRYVPSARQISAGTGLTGGGDLSSDRSLALTGQSLALHNLAANGLIARTGAATVAARTLTAGQNIVVTNGDGVSGDPTVAVSGQIPIANGGTGAADAATARANLGAAAASHTHPLSQLEQSGAATGQVPQWDGSAWTPKAALAQIDAYTSPGTFTWNKPDGAKTIELIIIGGGCGGGSGRRGAAGTQRGGGGGGSGGCFVHIVLPASQFGATVPVTVGAGGAGGASVTTDDTNGNLGTAGGDSSFGSIIADNTTGGAPGGTSSGGNGAIAENCGTVVGRAGGAGGSGSAGQSASFTGSGPGCGGGGAGISPANSVFAGGNGCQWRIAGTAVGGTGGSSGGGNGNNGNSTFLSGAGGGGGGSGLGVPGGNGGNGGKPGGGGGGGAASENGQPSGAGGNGGDGAVYVITYF